MALSRRASRRFAAQNFGAARPRAALNANFPFDFGKHPFFAFPRFYFIEARKAHVATYRYQLKPCMRSCLLLVKILGESSERRRRRRGYLKKTASREPTRLNTPNRTAQQH